MFERLFRLVLLVAVAAVLAYGGLWFRATDMAKEFVTETLDRHQNFSLGVIQHGGVKVTGFPLHPRLEVADLQVTLREAVSTSEESQPYLTFFLPSVAVESSIMGDKYIFYPTGTIRVTNTKNQTAEIKLDSPLAMVTLKSRNLSAFMNGELTPQSYHYEDKGMEMVETGGEKILSGPGASLTITHNFDQEGYHLQTNVLGDIAMEAGEGLQRFSGQDNTWKKFAMALNASGRQFTTDKQEENVEYTFTDASLTLDDLGITLQGKVTGDAAMLYEPDIDVDAAVKVTNYPQLLEYMVRSGWTDEKNKVALSKLIPDIADTMDEKHLTITLRHAGGKDVFHIGKLGMEEALTKFNAYGGNAVMAPQHGTMPEAGKR